MQTYRAYSQLEIKSVDDGRRLIRGTASTPTLDRQRHILDPAGATFLPEIPLLLHHNKQIPVGTARLWREGHRIAYEAELPVIAEPGPVKDEVDRAWTSITSRPPLIRGVSIGWLPLGEASIEYQKDGTTRFLRSEICELSLVTVPANTDATIARIKALDLTYQAAAGLPHQPGDSGGIPLLRARQGAPTTMTTETLAETIRTYENTRAAKLARKDAILATAAAAGLTLDGAQADEFDTLQADVDRIDQDLVRWRAHEKALITTAAPVPPTANGRPAMPMGVHTVKPNVPPGTAFVRAVCAKVLCKGNLFEAAEYAQRWKDSTPEVSLYLKAAVAAGNTTDPAWAAPLVGNITDDFLALVRPATALGKIQNMRRVPINTKVPAQTGGGTYGWVGEGKPKPVTKLAFSSTQLPGSKIAGIIVITEELARLSNPAAEDVARADMVAGIAAFADSQFLDPAVALVVGTHPASITNGVTPIASVGPLNDIAAIAGAFSAAGLPLAGLTYIMSPSNALVLSFQRDAQGNLAFPGMSVSGGAISGLSIVTSTAAGTNVIGLLPPLILFNDDGGVTIDVSREASLQMADNPMDPSDATTVFVSLWQNNLVGLRAEWFVAWLKANANAVKFVNSAAYSIPVPTGGAMAAGNGGTRAK